MFKNLIKVVIVSAIFITAMNVTVSFALKSFDVDTSMGPMLLIETIIVCIFAAAYIAGPVAGLITGSVGMYFVGIQAANYFAFIWTILFPYTYGTLLTLSGTIPFVIRRLLKSESWSSLVASLAFSAFVAITGIISLKEGDVFRYHGTYGCVDFWGHTSPVIYYGIKFLAISALCYAITLLVDKCNAMVSVLRLGKSEP